MDIFKHISEKGYYFQEDIDSLSDVRYLIELIFHENHAIKENVISIDANSNLPSDGFSDIPWHQEDYYKESRPNYLCLYCTSSGLLNEITRLVPTEGIVRELIILDPNIKQYQISFTRVRGILQSPWFPLIESLNGCYNLRFAQPDNRFRKVNFIPDNDISDTISNIIKVSETIDFVPKKGNLIIFDNFRFLHSRAELNINTSRKLHRFLVYSKNDL